MYICTLDRDRKRRKEKGKKKPKRNTFYQHSLKDVLQLKNVRVEVGGVEEEGKGRRKRKKEREREPRESAAALKVCTFPDESLSLPSQPASTVEQSRAKQSEATTVCT